MANMNTTSNISNVNKYYVRTLLDSGKMFLVHDRFAQEESVPKGNSKTVVFRRYSNFDLALAPLMEATPPEGKQMAATDIEATLQQWGDYTAVSDVLSWVAEDKVITQATELLGIQAGETLDTIYRDVLNGGSAVRYASNVAGRGSVINEIKDADIKAARRLLLSNKGLTITEILRASTGVGTGPLGSSYFGICHTDSLSDMEALTGWKNPQEYPNPSDAVEYEAGGAKNTRWLMTQNAKVWADNGAAVSTSGLITTSGSYVDVYSFLLFAKNAYGVCPLEGGDLEHIVEPQGSTGVGGPLHQYGTVGWKAMTACKILNDSWMVRIEAGVKA